jgi:hypothetical protein
VTGYHWRQHIQAPPGDCCCGPGLRLAWSRIQPLTSNVLPAFPRSHLDPTAYLQLRASILTLRRIFTFPSSPTPFVPSLNITARRRRQPSCARLLDIASPGQRHLGLLWCPLLLQLVSTATRVGAHDSWRDQDTAVAPGRGQSARHPGPFLRPLPSPRRCLSTATSVRIDTGRLKPGCHSATHPKSRLAFYSTDS